MQYALCDIEFSFNATMYRQKDGLGMGNILSSILANIFVGFYEMPCLSATSDVSKPMLYKRYVDDCYSMFTSKDEAIEFP